jgi:proteasome lid subunit RPN8/RPN11
VIRLSEAHREAIEAHGAREFPLECCGVLLGDVEGDVKIVREARPLANTFEPSQEFEASVLEAGQSAESLPEVGQERRYLVSPDEMFALMQEERRTKRKILGFYHSHPNHPARPSAYDREWASPWYTYIIVSVMNGQPADLTAWQLDDDRQAFAPEEIRPARRMKQYPGEEHGVVVSDFGFEVGCFVRQHDLGQCYAKGTGFLVKQDPKKIIAPDLAFIRKERLLPKRSRGSVPVVPDMVLEVRSPWIRKKQVEAKIQLWLSVGVRLVWELNLKARTLTVYRPGQPPRELGVNDTLTGEDILPGFELPLRRILDYERED